MYFVIYAIEFVCYDATVDIIIFGNLYGNISFENNSCIDIGFNMSINENSTFLNLQ